MAWVTRAAMGAAVLTTLPLRMAGIVAGRWLERAHDGGTHNAYSALVALRDHDADLDHRLQLLRARAG